MATMATMSIQTASLSIVHYPDPVLRQIAEPVADPSAAQVRDVAQRMIELMNEANGAGLAAPQVGLSWRLFVTRADIESQTLPAQVFINPVFSNVSREMHRHEEGCLSLPDIHVEVQRPMSLSITAFNLEGESFSVNGTDLAARVWQHEMDHLDGILILDRMSAMDRLANRRMIKDLETAYQPRRR